MPTVLQSRQFFVVVVASPSACFTCCFLTYDRKVKQKKTNSAGRYSRHSREPAGLFVLKINMLLNLCVITEENKLRGKVKSQKVK